MDQITATVSTTPQTVQAIVSRPKGSWKWQDAYAVSTYAVHVCRDGRRVWRMISRSAKMSLPQIVRRGYGNLHRGGMQNVEIA